MSAIPYRLELELDVEERTLGVTDRTSGRSYQRALPEGGLPYHLKLEENPQEAAEIHVTVPRDPPREPFDPARTTDCRILVLGTWIDESCLAQDDEAVFVVRIKNTATHYLAREICLTATLIEETSPLLPWGAPAVGAHQPGGGLYVELLPPDQHIKDLEPGEERLLKFLVITRGTVTGSYQVHFDLTYEVLYWDSRPARSEGTSSFKVEVPPLKPMRKVQPSRTCPQPKEDRDVQRTR